MEVGWVVARLGELMALSLYVRGYFRWAIWLLQVKRLIFSLSWSVLPELSFLSIFRLAAMESLLQEPILWVSFCAIIVVIHTFIMLFELIITEELLEFT
jgi:hypothetical protein